MTPNEAVFENIFLRFEELEPSIHQLMATTTREYLVKQFSDQGGDFGTWPAKVDGTTPTLYKTGNLFSKLLDIDKPGNYKKGGEKSVIILSVEALSDNGFDYGAHQQEDYNRIFFSLSYELNERILNIVKEELNRLK